MKYYIQRGVNEYGPYTLAELQRYVAQGNIAMSDLARSEGMTDWVPVSQVLGDIPIPVTAPTVPAAGGTVYGGASPYGTAAPVVAGPVPTDFHWALVLLITLVCYWFAVIWLFVEASFIKKIAPQSKGILLLAFAFAGAFVGLLTLAIAGEMDHGNSSPVASMVGLLILIVGCILYWVAVFSMRSDLEDYYNTTENIQLRLSGVGSALLTFFFAVYYFQWHFSRIAKWKKTGVLEPQS
ncbi:MAG TPA: DUF4339 domain-containing protein [Candidatus Angelobacter sp.]|nr:DUF4339 domain-containing protein [Candidatus Angelobacter sp.]